MRLADRRQVFRSKLVRYRAYRVLPEEIANFIFDVAQEMSDSVGWHGLWWTEAKINYAHALDL